MSGRLCYILVEKVLVIGKSIIWDFCYKRIINHKNTFVGWIRFRYLICYIFQASSHLSSLLCQSIWTMSRPSGSKHLHVIRVQKVKFILMLCTKTLIVSQIGTYDDMHEYNFFYLRKIGFYTLAIVLDRVMMASTLNVTTPI